MVETSQFNTPRRGHLHQGIDIASGEGNSAHLPVVVKVGGRVDYAGIASDGNGMVIINHPNGDVTRYLHLNNFRVRVGQNISAGTIIGRIAGPGESGYGTSDGAHLHFEYKPKGGYAVNPKQIWRNYVIIGGTVASTPTSNQSNSSSSSLTSPIKPNSRVGSRQPFNPASLSPVTPGGTTVVTLSSFSVYEDGKKVVYSRKRVNNSDVYTKNGKPISEDEYWKASNKKNNISSNQVDGKGTQLTVASSPQQQRLQQISNIATRMRTDIIKETQILIQPINT
jgi:hypothetical protein